MMLFLCLQYCTKYIIIIIELLFLNLWRPFRRAVLSDAVLSICNVTYSNPRYDSTWSFVRRPTIKTNLLFCLCTSRRTNICNDVRLPIHHHTIRPYLSFGYPQLFISHMKRSRRISYVTLMLPVQLIGPRMVAVSLTDTYLDRCNSRNTLVAWCAPWTAPFYCLCVFTDIPSIAASGHSSNLKQIS